MAARLAIPDQTEAAREAYLRHLMTRQPALRQANPNINEWPIPPNAPDENQQFLVDTYPPTNMLPKQFANARNAEWRVVPANDRELTGDGGIAKYGYAPTQDELRIPDPKDPRFAKNPNRIGVSADAFDNPAPEVWAHEAYHSIEDNDLPAQQWAGWKALIDSKVSQLRNEFVAAGIGPDTKNSDPRIQKIISKYPKALIYYMKEPDPNHEGALYRETWGELGGQFMANPTALEKTYPDIYNFIRGVGGADYRPGVRVVDSKPAWEYPGAFTK